MRISSRVWVAALVTPLLLSCGGGSKPSPSEPVATGTPAPTPTPSPTPTPTPTSGSGTNPGGTLLGGARIGDTLNTLLTCSGAVRFDAEGNWSEFVRTEDRAKDDNGMSITIAGLDSYGLNINGFTGSGYGPQGKRSNSAFHRFVIPDGEFQIPRDEDQLEFATYGLLAEGSLCFFAGTQADTDGPPASGQTQYTGLADGMWEPGTYREMRLFGSTAQLVHRDDQLYDLVLTLRGVADPYSDPVTQESIPWSTLRAVVTYEEGTFPRVETQQSDGLLFTVAGRAGGPGHLGSYFVWQVRDPYGLLAYGVIAADGNQI